MQSVRVLETIIFCGLFTNRLRPFLDFIHHTVTSITHSSSFHRRHERNSAIAKQSLAVGVSCLYWFLYCSFSYSLKYFHATNTFAVLVHISIWSCHLIVRYNLFGFLTYSAEQRKSIFFVLFSVGSRETNRISRDTYIYTYICVCVFWLLSVYVICLWIYACLIVAL